MRRSTVLQAAGRYTPVTLLLLVWCCQSLGYAQPEDYLQMVATGGVVLLGAAALGWLRPPRVGLTAPQAMLMLGAIGMLLGLMVDSRTTELSLLASLCASTGRNLWPTAQLHWALLPWMHVGMWTGGFATIPLLRAIRPACRRQYCVHLAQNFACSAWMTVGMSAGMLVSEYLASRPGSPSAASMLGGMFSGMVWGMVASVALYRLYFRVRPVIDQNFNRRDAEAH